jgi:hypothetical protein
MKRLALVAGPLFLVALIAGTAVAIQRRRASRRVMQAPRLGVSVRDAVSPATRSATAGGGVEVLAGYDERREEEEEARHGAVLHIDVGRLSVGQI